MSRSHRYFAALLAASALVFAQLAVSAHACDIAFQQLAAETAPAHECCNDDNPGTSSAGGSACVEHCQNDQASFGGGQSAQCLVDAAGPTLRVDADDSTATADCRLAWLLVPAAAPPPAAILFGVLRI